MCVVELDGKVVIIDQSNEIDSLVIGLENAVQAVRLSCDKIGGLRLRIMELEAQVAVLKEITIKEKASGLFNNPWDSGLSYGCRFDVEIEACQIEARRQLAEEYPEIFGD